MGAFGYGFAVQLLRQEDVDVEKIQLPPFSKLLHGKDATVWKRSAVNEFGLRLLRGVGVGNARSPKERIEGTVDLFP